VNEVPERIESADVIVRSEGSGFAQRIAAGPHRLMGNDRESVGGTGSRISPSSRVENPPKLRRLFQFSGQ
jgi:hypothetical protein